MKIQVFAQVRNYIFTNILTSIVTDAVSKIADDLQRIAPSTIHVTYTRAGWVSPLSHYTSPGKCDNTERLDKLIKLPEWTSVRSARTN